MSFGPSSANRRSTGGMSSSSVPPFGSNHAVASPTAPIPGGSIHTRREVIEINSDDEHSTPGRISSNPLSRVTAPPTSVPGNGSRNKRTSGTAMNPPYDVTSTPPAAAPPAHRASASPSIASLINPDTDSNPVKKPKLMSAPPPTTYVSPAPTSNPTAANTGPTSTNALEPKKEKTVKTEKGDKSPKAKTATAATSPKPARAAPAPKPPPPSGNGLLSGMLSGASAQEEPAVPNIYIHVPLNGETNKYINFARLAEERYGWAALNPRLAKAKAAMQADSGDEMMVDGSDTESNNDTAPEKQAEQPKKRQKRSYQDIYDKNDPFIDDSEMLWEAQAATSKDGFFVYSGPLIPEGQKPQIERADGTVRRGRGRGRGRGGASTRGSGTTARKPRITKKEKEKLEKEKEERERLLAFGATLPPPR